MTEPRSPGSTAPPAAVLKPRRTWSLAWLVPLLILPIVGVVVVKSLRARGPTIEVRFADGRGLRAGDDVRYRGIIVGEVTSVELSGDTAEVRATARLNRDAERLATAGARFWVARPVIGWSQVTGVDTLLGSRYLAALPAAAADDAAGEPCRQFVGLEQPIVVDSVGAGDLEIVLEGEERNGLAPGVPVTYRDVEVGTVMSVALAGDARSVEARVHVPVAYAEIVRDNSRFAFAGGVKADFVLSMLSVEVGGNLMKLLAGGSVVVATPDGGAPVKSGHRFRLEKEVDEEWSEWRPALAVGSAFLPKGVVPPRPLAVRMTWNETGLFTRHRARSGFVLATDRGLLGPADLLTAPAGKDVVDARLEVAGQALDLARAAEPIGEGLALREAPAGIPRVAWPAPPRSAGPDGPDAPCDCVAFPSGPEAPFVLPAHRLHGDHDSWRFDPELPVDAAWHGAPVLARETGALVGLLLVEDRSARVALVSPKVSAPSRPVVPAK